MGLPRSNLVKKTCEVTASPASPAPAASIPPPPASILLAQTPATPPETPAATPPETPAATPPAPARESFHTKADSVEVQVESQAAPPTSRDPSPPVTGEPVRSQYSSSPSAGELLERAAALGPARMTWESIVIPADPILHEKSTPHVAERRARLTRMVKIGLGACLGVCVLALGITAVSGDASAAAMPPASEALAKTVPSKGIVPVEPLDGTRHAKSIHRAAPAVTTAAIVRNKHR